MGSLALSAVFLFALLMPGIVCRAQFQLGFKSVEVEPLTEAAATSNLLYALPIALLFHVVWLGSIQAAATLFGTTDLSIGLAIDILVGPDANNGQSLSSALLPKHVYLFVAYFLSQVAAAYLVATLVVALMIRNGYLRTVALRSKGATWHRLLKFTDYNPQPDFVLISLTITLGDKTLLYFGIVDDYETDPDGNLIRVTLNGAYRKHMDDSSQPQELPGEQFVVNCADAKTADVDYFWVEEVNAEAEAVGP